MNDKPMVRNHLVTDDMMNDYIRDNLGFDTNKPVVSKNFWRGCLYALPISLVLWAMIGVSIWLVVR